MTDDINDVRHTSTLAKFEEAVRRSSPDSASDLEKADMCERLSFPPEDARYITVDKLLREYAAILRSRAQAATPPELVAFRVKFKGDTGWTLYYSDPRKDLPGERGWLESVEPLYAVSPPPTPDHPKDSGECQLPLRYIDGPDYCTVKDATDKDFALTVQPEFLKAMEKALSEDIARLSRPPAQPRQDRDETLSGLAEFFSESVHHVWSNDEVAQCLTEMIGQGSVVSSTHDRTPSATTIAALEEARRGCNHVWYQTDPTSRVCTCKRCGASDYGDNDLPLPSPQSEVGK